MAKMTLSYKDLYDQVSYFLGLTAQGTSPTGNDLTKCKDIVARGIRQFMYPLDATGEPYEWSFIRKYYTFSTAANKWKYSLPVDFSDIYEDSQIHYDPSNENPPLMKRDPEQIIALRTGVDATGYPEYFAIMPITYNIETGTSYELWIYPTPTQANVLSFFYRIDPVQLSATTDLVIGGIRVIEAILESCLAVAEHQEDEMTTTHHTVKAAELIQTAIKFDKKSNKSDVIGNIYYNMEQEWPRPRGYFTYPDTDNVYP